MATYGSYLALDARAKQWTEVTRSSFAISRDPEPRPFPIRLSSPWVFRYAMLRSRALRMQLQAVCMKE
ncbi:hypothetical protein VTK73DRAFT_1189 [Phialemonium thermophilum]|uniref:Uncharacterized protein n=1 Tax=Phialemonium thermophilum TaxID=223376 RepID=A0ABR3VTS1_9PEZI